MRQMFKSTTVNVGEIKKGQKNVVVDFEFDSLRPDEIATYVDAKGNEVPAIGFSCGCTGTPEIFPDKLRVLYNDGGNVSGAITKSITVFYKPATDILIRVKNERGVEVWNPELSKTVLVFNATAV